ncbi:MAG: zinc ribbon domain-containing protein [Leptolyngbyaceae cyanobacterium MO_188.B28]|nr:zinc ribbon domain-containing protein [Leptolyngbyaceae cyanobacterium MO_188.B28]
MPLYEFRCQIDGDFDAWRRLADFDKPMSCPTCQGSVKRLFSPPNISLNSGGLGAIARQASSEPRVVKRDREPTAPRYQSAASSRPWMVGHAPERL